MPMTAIYCLLFVRRPRPLAIDTRKLEGSPPSHLSHAQIRLLVILIAPVVVSNGLLQISCTDFGPLLYITWRCATLGRVVRSEIFRRVDLVCVCFLTDQRGGHFGRDEMCLSALALLKHSYKAQKWSVT